MIYMLVDSQVGPRIEPGTPGIQSRCSDNWATGAAAMTIPLGLIHTSCTCLSIVANTTDYV